MNTEVLQKGEAARRAAAKLATVSAKTRDAALHAIANALVQRQDEIARENEKDMRAGREAGLKETLLDRLLLTEPRIAAMADGLRQITALPDPIGEVEQGWQRPNGLRIQRVRVPLGVIGMIYEARPNVTVDAAGLCVKAGNAVILRGGKEAIHSNLQLVKIIAGAGEEAGLPKGSVQLIESTERQTAQDLMKANGLIDVLIPRGGAGLIRAVVENATVPVIETGVGNCHVYIDAEAEPDMATAIAINAKTQRPGVCNAIETLLVHEKHAATLLPDLLGRLSELGVEIRGCERTRAVFPAAKPATEDDWRTEFLALILAVRVVDSLDAAIAHIRTYSSKHSEAIVTENYAHAERFLAEVDAAAVYVNASTRFTDGFEFGFGAEIGISTQKLHARGPMGLTALTSSKYIIRGDGQVRE